MSVAVASPLFAGPEGELLLVRLQVPAVNLETVLDSLALLPFPINPELRHGYPESVVEFPAYATRTEEIRCVLDASGLTGVRVSVSPLMLSLR